MDANSVYQLFGATYHADPNVRSQAEANLKQAEAADGFLAILVQIIGAPESDNTVRQAVSIYFKNRVCRAWNPNRVKDHHIGPNDRVVVKQSILQLLVSVPQNVRLQLATALHEILLNEYPDNWPEFVPNIQILLQSTDNQHAIYAGLVALQQVVRVYRWKASGNREPLNQIVAHVFPAVHSIAAKLSQMDSLEAAQMLHLVLKTYYASMQYELPEALRKPEGLVPWVNVFMFVIQKEVPMDASMPQDPAEREKHPWWKAKKWAYHCIYNLFSTFGNPSYSKGSEKASSYKEFSTYFTEHFVDSILQSYLKQVEMTIAGVWMSNRVMQQLALFLTECVKRKNTWLALKPHLGTLVSKFIFPMMCFSEADSELWESDPVELIQRRMDPLEDYRNAACAAEGLLTALVKVRFKQTFVPVVGFINGLLTSYNESPPEQRDPRQKDGALWMISAITDVMYAKQTGAEQIEPFLVAHVFPEFKSQYPFLRARACTTLLRCIQQDEMQFSHPEHIAIAVQSVLTCLQDPDMIVKVYAALSLTPFMDYGQYIAAREDMKPHVSAIMAILLKLTNEIDMDTITHVMEQIVGVFGEQIAPFALQLGAELTDSFLRIMGEVEAAETDNDDLDIDEQTDKVMAASGLLNTICSLITSVHESKEILLQLETVVAPGIQFTLQHNVLDLYDSAFEVVSAFTFYAKVISPTMWAMLPHIYQAFKTDGADYIEEIQPSLDNFIQYGSEVMAANKQYQHMMYDIIETLFKTRDSGQEELIRACEMINTMLFSLTGHIDEYVPQFLSFAFEKMRDGEDKDKTVAYKIHLIEVVVSCIYYNPALTLALLEQHQQASWFFTIWFQELGDFRRVHDKRLAILALCKIISLPVDKIPPSIQQGWGQVFAGILKLFESYPEALKERKRVADVFSNDDDEDVLEEEDDDDDETSGRAGTTDEVTDDGDVKDEDDSYLEYLTAQGRKLAKLANGGGDDDDEDDDFGFGDDDDDGEYGFEYDDGLMEDIYFTTALDEIDPYIVFQDTMSRMPAEQQSFVAQSLSPENREQINKIMETATQNRQKDAAAS
ncbi:hypothetical protein HK102_009952 [Quaeritorhiza haematococci]|nr:hypothetical protein HK102_009952 [Quaeritorhiza haematococci]